MGVYVVSCTHQGIDHAQSARPTAESVTVGQTQTEISGEAAYNTACASCHETGLNGAPVAGDPNAWSGRSQLWEAVLFDHAKNGYMEMPGKGGNPDLSDQVVAAAAEYMLLITYPDRRPD